MATTNSAYSQARIDQIQRLLERLQTAGDAKEYDILVDNIPVVPRTHNLELFNSYEEEIQPDTRNVTIRIYQGSSHNCDRYMFNLNGGGANGLGGLSGTEGGLEGLIEKEVNRKKLEWDHDLLGKDFEELKKENRSLKTQNDKLETELNSLQSTHSKMGMFGALAGPFVDNLLGNSKLLKRTPLGNLLVQNSDSEIEASSQGDASFSPANGLSGNANLDPQMVEFCQYIESAFTHDEFDQILSIIGQMGSDKTLIPTIVGLIAKPAPAHV
jgi:hypothetical protein